MRARSRLRAPGSAAAHTRAALTRREVLGAAAGATAMLGLEALPARAIQRALAAMPAKGKLRDIKHVVIFVTENRSSDHYYGTYRGVRAFAAPAVLNQSDGAPG